MPAFDNMHIYMLPGCPYCMKVDRFLDAHGIDIEHRNSADPDIRAELIAIGGKSQSPCLVVDGKPLYESDDIIAFLQTQL